jgi:glutathionylspermidine synthase
MRRVAHEERRNWRAIVESQGLAYAVDRGSGQAYWHEAHAYEFSGDEIEYLERLTEEAHRMCVEAAHHLLAEDRLWNSLGLPARARPFLAHSLATEQNATLYGRFDLAHDGEGPARILEYNADTPAGLVEAAVCQWDWLEWAHPDLDQWNMIHERLVKAWRDGVAGGARVVHLAAGEAEPSEDWCTVAYVADTAAEAGLDVVTLPVEQIGWHAGRRRFVDLVERDIDALFSMYPWEWLFSEAFAEHLFAGDAGTRFVEPAWKCLLSSKTILVALHEVFPDHASVLPATLGEPGPWQGYVAKPVFGWEGAGVQVVTPDFRHAQDPRHTAGQALVHQAYTPLGPHHPVLGTWVIAGRSAGLGIREQDGPVTDTGARFVPHYLTTPRSTPQQVAEWLLE